MTVISFIKRAYGSLRRRVQALTPTAKRQPGSAAVEAVNGFATETLAEALADRIADGTENPVHDVFYRRGFHLLRKHFYLPIPDDTDELDDFWGKPSSMPGVAMNDTLGLDLMENVLPPYLEEFRERFPIEKGDDPSEFFLINGGYMAVDAHVYYGLIRHFKPRRIIEIGCGNSTMLAAAAIARNAKETGHKTHLTAIDPYPWDLFKDGYAGLDELLVKRVQDAPLSTFDELESGDILFIDSSHVIRSGNDVHFEFLEVLPRLRRGIMVHVHDISLPKPYPKTYYDNQLYWNEQYLLQAFLAFNSRFEVLWPGNYMLLTHPEITMATFPEISIMRKHYPQSEPTAFWMRTKQSNG